MKPFILLTRSAGGLVLEHAECDTEDEGLVRAHKRVRVLQQLGCDVKALSKSMWLVNNSNSSVPDYNGTLVLLKVKNHAKSRSRT